MRETRYAFAHMERVFSNLPPVCFPESETLILGAFPSPKSRALGFYYANPQNRFWPALAGACGHAAPRTQEERDALLLQCRVALWDVLASCRIEGASDASIRDPVVNNVSALLKTAPITRVFCTGQTAARLYTRYLAHETQLPCRVLPSPSAANAKYSLPALVFAYRALLFLSD